MTRGLAGPHAMGDRASDAPCGASNSSKSMCEVCLDPAVAMTQPIHEAHVRVGASEKKAAVR